MGVLNLVAKSKRPWVGLYWRVVSSKCHAAALTGWPRATTVCLSLYLCVSDLVEGRWPSAGGFGAPYQLSALPFPCPWALPSAPWGYVGFISPSQLCLRVGACWWLSSLGNPSSFQVLFPLFCIIAYLHICLFSQSKRTGHTMAIKPPSWVINTAHCRRPLHWGSDRNFSNERNYNRLRGWYLQKADVFCHRDLREVPCRCVWLFRLQYVFPEMRAKKLFNFQTLFWYTPGRSYSKRKLMGRGAALERKKDCWTNSVQNSSKDYSFHPEDPSDFFLRQNPKYTLFQWNTILWFFPFK